MPKPSKLKSTPHQLLVEGNTDKRVIEALYKEYQISEKLFTFAFPQKGGVENLIKIIPTKLKEENLETLGIVVDADEDVSARWQALINKLQAFGYQNIPKILPPTGWIDTQSELPKIGVWIMPNNNLPGMLEDFVAYLIPEEDKLKAKIQNFLQEIETEKLNLYSPTQYPKVLIYTWLALQKKPGMPMGRAITAKALSNDSKVAQTFITWLQKLFDE
jgi:hypothetical protein